MASRYVLQSEPYPVRFAGFESTTTRLQAAGWQLAVHEDFHRARVELVGQLADAGLYLYADADDVEFFRGHHGPVFTVRRVSSRIVSRLLGTDFSRFCAIDAMPQMVEVNEQDISQFSFFAAPLVRTEEIIVEPQSVAECLDLIKRLQAPELAEIRKRNMRREGEVQRQTTFHAQIISLAA